MVVLVVYGAYRSQDPSQETTWLDMVLMYPVIFLILGTVVISARRAHFAKSKFWMFASIFFWPLSFVYTLAINKGSAEDEFWWQARR